MEFDRDHGAALPGHTSENGIRGCEFNGVFEVATLEMLEGDPPQRAQRLVRDWAEQYKGELERMWKIQDFKKLPGLE
jgi:hypothetical protein